MNQESLSRALQRGERGGVFFLHGDEDHLKEVTVAAIVAAHLDPATRDFNLDQLRGSEIEAEALASILQTPPLMAEWRVVVVREAHVLAANARTRAVVEALLERPWPGLVVILTAQLPAGKRAKFWERLIRDAHAVELNALASGDLPGWLMERAGSLGMELEPAAARDLAAAAGPALAVLLSELEKLAGYASQRKRITAADVRAVVSSVPRHNRWEWFDAVGERRFAHARRALPALLESGESGVGLVLGLGTHFLRLALAQDGERALAAELPPHQRWLGRRLAGQARRWSREAVEAALDDLLRADRILKSTALSDDQVMDELLLRLQAGQAATAGAGA
jgi:DNA polymerase III subunit delta